MAEKVTIATIDLDSVPVDTKIRNTGQSFAGFGREVDRTSNVFTNRMFNMRTAALAFLGGFTLAGAILELKNFIGEVFKASTEFHRFRAASSAAFSNLTKLAVEILPVNSALSSMTAWLERISGSMALLRSSAKNTDTGWMWKLLWGLTPVGKITQMLDLLGKAIDKAAPGLRAAGREPYIPKATRLEGDLFLREPLRPLNEFKFATVGIDDYADSVRQASEAHRNWMHTVNGAGAIIEENITTPMDEAWHSVAKHTEAIQFWQQTLAGGLSLLGSAVAESGFTARKALATLFQTMSQMAFSFAAMHIAAAVAATTGLGAIVTGGTTGQHARAAAKWFGAGLLMAVAASKVGGGASNTAYGSGAGGGAEAAGPSGRSYQVGVTIEGSVIGVGMSADQFARYIAGKINRALGDGVAGGDINFQTVNG